MMSEHPEVQKTNFRAHHLLHPPVPSLGQHFGSAQWARVTSPSAFFLNQDHLSLTSAEYLFHIAWERDQGFHKSDKNYSSFELHPSMFKIS